MNRKTKSFIITFFIILCVAFSAVIFSACSSAPKKEAVSVLIIPKFEIDEMSGDFPGEAQFFYEKYCKDCEEIEIPNMPDTAHFYYNDDNDVGLLVAGVGKSIAGLSLSSLLSSDSYDFSNAYIVSVGCSGGSADYTTLGDVVLLTSVCDYDLGHKVDSRELSDTESTDTWFPGEDYDKIAFKRLDKVLCKTAYGLTKDCPVKTTALSKKILKKNFPDSKVALRDPVVLKGTSASGDNFWKGEYGHRNAVKVAKYYGAPDPYAVTEMEEIGIMNAAESFGMLDRVISFRVVVNYDLFLRGETPEGLWAKQDGYSDKVSEENSETLDIFEPAMQNLFDVSSIVIDAILEGEIG